MSHLSPRRFGRTMLIAGALALVTAVSAGATAIYAIPGSPGGPPTEPNGAKGTAATNAGVESLGTVLAGSTAAQLLALQTANLNVHFNAAGTIYGRVSVAGYGELGQGFTGRANQGTSTVAISFSARGRAYLALAGSTPVTLKLKYAFQPNITGPTKYSTATVVTAP